MTDAADNLVIVVAVPGLGTVALTVAEVRAGRERAQQLGFGAEGQAAERGTAPERWLTSQELAALLQIADTRLEHLASRGAIPHLRVGRSLRFKATEVERALRDREIKRPQRANAEASEITTRETHYGRRNSAPAPS